MSKIKIVILHYGKIATTQSCLKSLSSKLAECDLILVNNTQDDIANLQTIFKQTTIINNHKNLGFAKGVNIGLKEAIKDKGMTHVLLLNNDLHIAKGSLDQLMKPFRMQNNIGIVAPVLHHAGGYDWGGKYSKLTGMVKHQNWPNAQKTLRSVEHVAGAAMLMSLELIDKVVGFDERFFLYYEDLDFCIRTRQAGFQIIINQDVIAEHSVSLGTNPIPRHLFQWRSHLLFITKHLGKNVYPTAYLYSFIFYPLVLTKLFIYNLIKQND